MDFTKLHEHLEEIKKLYELSESDVQCMMQLFMMVKLNGYSPRLTVKLMKALTAMMEAGLDLVEKEHK